MKTMTTHTLRATLMALFCLVALSAMADATVNVTTTEGGQLQAKVEETGNAASDITSLTVTGPLNGTDIDYLRTSLTAVQDLEMTDARIVDGGSYYANGYSQYCYENRISNNMFYKLTSLVTLKMPSTVTKIDYYACSGCTNLTNVVLPTALEGKIEDYSFYNCRNLTEIAIPEGVTEIGGFCFYGCQALSVITLPSTLTSIGQYAFQNCNALTSIALPASITHLDNGVFYNCTNLQTARLGKSIDYSRDFNYFVGCTSLQELYINYGKVYEYDYDGYIKAYCANCTLYVPEGSESSYAASPFWSQFKEIKTFETGNLLNEAEFALLQQIYTALDGAHWTQPWDLSKRSCSQGKWAGLTLDLGDDSHITAIDLSDMGLEGTLPVALFQFPQVTTLNLSNNGLEGNVNTLLSDEFRNSTITDLRLMDNRLTGDLSQLAKHFPALTRLDVSYNRLSACSENLSLNYSSIDYRMQFVDYKTKQYVASNESPVHDILIGEDFNLTFNSLQTYNGGSPVNPDGNSLNRLYFSSDYLNTFYSEIKWQQDGNAYNLGSDFRAPRGEVLFYSPENISISNGYVPVFLRFDWLDGDVNANGDVDVTDLTLLVNRALTGSVPNGERFNFTCADDNADDVLDVYDAVRCVNHILDFEPSADARQARYVRRAQAEATANSITIADQTLSLATDGAVSAMQFTLSGANEADIHLARRYQSFLTMATRQVGNDVRVVLYNTEGRTLAQGMHNLLSVSEGCELSDAMLSDSEGHRLPAAIGGNTTGIDTVTAEGANAAYDLQGRRSSAQRGIHIINNKKVLKR